MLEKVVLISAAYFCIATEMRFLESESSDDCLFTTKDAETFHAKALHIALLFLPEQCPLA
jgi:hypothetical protein